MKIPLNFLERFDESIIRRSIILFLLIFPGFILNYLLVFGARKILLTEEFGIFYTAISVTNILISPAIVLGFYFSRRIAERKTKIGLDSAISEFKYFFRKMAKWGAVSTIALLLVLQGLGYFIGIKSYILLFILVVGNYGNYLMEFVRTGLQGLQKFVWLGIAGFSWLVVRFVFGMTGLYFSKTVWIGIMGILVSAVPICYIFYKLIIRLQSRIEETNFEPVYINKLILFMSSYAIFAVVMYTDILIAYMNFDKISLTIYSASSYLPKCIILVMLPILQVMFPTIVSGRAENKSQRVNLLKGVLLSIGVSVAGAAFLIVFGKWICNSSIGIQSCDLEILKILSISSIFICLIRVIVMSQLARGYDAHTFLLLGPLGIYILYILITKPDIIGLANTYLIFSIITLISYSLISLKTTFIWQRFVTTFKFK